MIFSTTKSKDFGYLKSAFAFKFRPRKNRRVADRNYKKLDNITAKEISAGSTKVIHTYEDGAFSFIEAKEKEFNVSL